jgi:CubicO group peptidase (beta-lactamase class C family)
MSHLLRALLAVLCQLWLLTAAQGAGQPAPPPQTIPELQTRLGQILTAHKLPGAGVALFNRDGVIWAGGVGYRDTGAKRPVTADTLFRVGSITKGFVAVALLQLVERGKLDLHANLRDIAPEIPVDNPWEASSPVTVAEVLEHTAGFDDMHFPKIYNFQESPDIALLTVIQRSASELHVRWCPGTRVSYSNVDYLVAGYLLEKLSGEPYERFVEEHVLRPLGMVHASLALDPATRAALAQGYEGGDQHPVDAVQIYLRPAGALNASPAELAHFGVLLLNRGVWHNTPLLTAASVTRMETPETSLAARHGLDFGYGLANYTSYIDGYEFHGHDGGIDGFVSRYAYAPDQGVGFVFLLNTGDPDGAARECRDLIVSYLMRDQPKPMLPSPVPVAPAVLLSESGYYREENPRNQVMAVADYLLGTAHLVPDGHGGLQLESLFDKPETLVSAGTNLWRRPENPGPDTIAYATAEGEQVLDFEAGASGASLVKTSFISAYAPLAFACLALLLMLSSLLLAPVWIVVKLVRRTVGVSHWSVQLLPLAATVSFVVMLASLVGIEPIQLGTPNIRTITYCISSVVFAVLSAAAFIQALRAFQWPLQGWLRWYSLTVSSACFGLALFLASWGLIGLMAWRF